MTRADFTEERFEIGRENAPKWKYIRAWITDVSPILITAVIDLQAAIER
ncbi:hypothetical protein [Methylobacterium sp. E-045]|nr:hypothetical protein [Methylobacterium sp. E-045]MCJ2131154.1 hypothetical protein [Methylobacterium sp. E-045]